jgi:hypothetical protein
VVEDPEYSVKLVAEICSSSLSVVLLVVFFLVSWTYPTMVVGIVRGSNGRG